MEDMTIDELARIVAEGFSSMREYMDERFEKLEEEMKLGFKEVNERVDAIVIMLEDHSHRIKKLELTAS